MYEGALHALSSTTNPDRYAQAAHSLREIMEKIHRYADTPVPRKEPNLGSKTQELIAVWAEGATPRLVGEAIDQALARFLKTFGVFAEWHQVNRPRQRERTRAVLAALDPSRMGFPEPIKVSRAEEWQHCQDFFVAVAHHRTSWDVAEFAGWLTFLDETLLGYLLPRTFATFDRLDGLVAEGESHAD